MIVGWILGFLMEKVAFRPLRTAGHMPPLLITIGLSIMIRDLVHIFLGAENRPVPSIYEQTFEVAGTQVSVLQVLLLAIAVVLIVILRLLIYGTKIGRAMRATAQDKNMAMLVGIDVDRVISVTFVIGSATAALGGVLIASHIGQINFYVGFIAGIKAFVAAVLGGIGSIPGAVLGSLVLGWTESFFTGYVSSDYEDVFAFLFLVFILTTLGSLIGTWVGGIEIVRNLFG